MIRLLSLTGVPLIRQRDGVHVPVLERSGLEDHPLGGVVRDRPGLDVLQPHPADLQGGRARLKLNDQGRIKIKRN